VNVAVVLPEATVTVDGTVNNVLSLARETSAPPAGADWESVTVHAAEEFFLTDLPLQFREPTTT
jgi:hypothetical protein